MCVSDDDYELPSLSERIKNNLSSPKSFHMVSDAESDENEFLKSLERVKITSQASVNEKDSSNAENDEISERIKNNLSSPKSFHMVSDVESDENEFLKSLERVKITSQASVNEKDSSNAENDEISERIKNNLSSPKSFHMVSDVESDENEFLKSLERVKITSQASVNEKGSSNAENDEISERIKNNLSSPKSFHTVSDVESDENEFLKSLERVKITSQASVNENDSSDAESDENRFLNFLEKIKNTPYSQFKKNKASKKENIPPKINSSNRIFKSLPLKTNNVHIDAESNRNFSSDSDDESSILKFSEKIRNTPHSKNVIYESPNIESKSEDEVFEKLTERFQRTLIPRSQIKNSIERKLLFSPNSSEKKRLSFGSDTAKETIDSCISSEKNNTVPGAITPAQLANMEEFVLLLPPESETTEMFIRNRKKYAKKIFDFFNKKIFNSQLPKDMPLIWNDTFLTTAGITDCSYEDDIHTCSIELSSKLLISVDRLRDTLLHEMCHAAVWIVSKNTNVNHGPLWQIWASRCKLIIPSIECPERCHNYEVKKRIWYSCPKCNWRRGRYRRSKRLTRSVCQICKTPIVITTAN